MVACHYCTHGLAPVRGPMRTCADTSAATGHRRSLSNCGSHAQDSRLARVQSEAGAHSALRGECGHLVSADARRHDLQCGLLLCNCWRAVRGLFPVLQLGIAHRFGRRVLRAAARMTPRAAQPARSGAEAQPAQACSACAAQARRQGPLSGISTQSG